MARFLASLLLLVFTVVLSYGTAHSLEKPEGELAQAALYLRQGEKVNLDLSFTDSNGARVRLGDFFKSHRPVVLIPAYYHCPRLCGLVHSGAVKLLNQMEFVLGEDYEVITVSFDSTEGPDLAAKTAEKYRGQFKTPADAARGWEFLVGDEQSVKELMDSVGFRYRKDNGEFAHTAALILLTPQGEISQYFTGVSFPPSDFRLALVDASKGAIGSILDHVYLFCFRYDHLQGKYTWAVFNIVRAVGFATLFGLIFLFVRLRRREKAAAVA